MDERFCKKAIRKEFSKQGWALLIYYGIMNVAVLLCTLIDLIIWSVRTIMEYGFDVPADYAERMMESVLGNAWGYFLAAAVGFLILLLWKGRRFTFGEIWTKGRPMRVGEFIPITCIFLSAQVIFQIIASILEMILNSFGLSAMHAIESATSNADTFSMFLYAGILAPIAEEILFRGLILRSLMPFGKKLAIFVSALLFGVFHGNIVQSPFAFMVGLVLGYVAVEYSVAWAMVLHMFNNLVISDILTRLTFWLFGSAAGWVSQGVIYVLSVAGVVFLIVKRKEVGVYLRRERMNPYYLKCCFTSAGIIVLLILMGILMLTSITPI